MFIVRHAERKVFLTAHAFLYSFALVSQLLAQTELFSYSKYDFYEGHKSSANAIAFDSKGKLLASGGKDGVVILRNVEQRQIVRRLEGHTKPINALAFRSDGKLLASASDDKTVRVWDLQTGASKVLSGHGKEVRAVAFSPSGDVLASGGADKQILLWSSETGEQIGSLLDHTKKVKFLFFIKDEILYSIGEENKIIEWDVKAKRVLRSWQESAGLISCAAISPNGEWLILGTQDSFIKKGGVVLEGGGATPGDMRTQSEIKIYSLASGGLQKVLDAGNRELPSLSISADSGFLTGISRAITKSSIVVWDIKRGEQVAVIEQPTKDDMLTLAFSINGKWLAAGNEKGKVDVWETKGIYPGPAQGQVLLRGQKNVFLTSREPLFSFTQPTTLALLDLDANGIDPSLSKVVSEQIRARVAGGPNIKLVERQKIERVLQEQKFQQSGATDPVTAARIGKILNIKKIGYGSLSKLGKSLLVTVQLVDVETAGIDGIRQMTCNSCAEEELIETIAEMQPALIPAATATKTASATEIKSAEDSGKPQINVTYPGPTDSVDQQEIVLQGTVNDASGLSRISVSLSNASRGLSLSEEKSGPTEITFSQPTKSYTLERRIKLSPGSNVITVTVENKAGFQEQITRVIYLEEKNNSSNSNRPIGQRWAFIVGISDYQDSKITPLKYAHRDAEEIYKFLQTASGGSYSKDRIVFLANREATWEKIRVELREFLSKPEPDDLVFIYIAAHANPDPYQPSNVYLIAHNTQVDKLLGTALSIREIELALRENLRAQKVVMFADTCYSASFTNIGTRDVRASADSINFAFNEAIRRSKPGTFIVTSALGNEVSLEGSKWGGGHGVFTWHLLEALRGKADKDGDGYVTAEEVFDYVQDNVRKDTAGRQHPANLSSKYDPKLPLAIYTKEKSKPDK